MSNIDEFRNELNKNTKWQEELKNLVDNSGMIQFAGEKGYEFTDEDLDEWVKNNKDVQLSAFEMEMVAGGGHGGGNSF